MRQWTYLEIKRLANLYTSFNVAGCAFILKRSPNSIRHKLKELELNSPYLDKSGKQNRKYYAEDIANIMELRSQQFSWNEIGKCFNTSGRKLQHIVSYAKRHGFNKYPKRGLS